MKQVIVWQHNLPGSDPDRFFIVELPVRPEKGYFNTSRSFSWFCHRELERAFPSNKEDWVQYAKGVTYCTEEHRVDWFCANMPIDKDTIPVCKSLAEFYSAIGYDIKKKRYIK